MSSFVPCSKDLFFKSTKAQDPRLGELVNSSSSAEQTFIIAGYPDDEGIRINGGRLGAALAPDVIRKYFYKTTPVEKNSPYSLADFGNLKNDISLEKRHEIVKKEVAQNLKENKIWIGLGGGHDYGYADGAGFLDWCQTQKNSKRPVVINFDAHLDVRKPSKDINSGTPFYRLNEMGIDFDFVQIGIQKQCNS
ncbi:arginase family protein, partial [bacterium]|nr:arginase family protein [bacterium]